MNWNRFFIAIRGIIYASGFVILWAWFAVLVRSFDAKLPFVLHDLLKPIGVVIGSFGALIAVWCITTFITKGRGTPAPFDPPSEFVETGPYRYVRNPMYIGGSLVILSGGFILNSPSIVLLTGVFWFFTHLLVILYEEPTLENRFGDSYRDYMESVNRWRPTNLPYMKE